MRSQSEFQQALHWFCKEVGVPASLVMDRHKTQRNLSTKKFFHQVGTIMRVLKVDTPWVNQAELYIGLLKEAVCRDLKIPMLPRFCETIVWNNVHISTTLFLVHFSIIKRRHPIMLPLVNREIFPTFVPFHGISGFIIAIMETSLTRANALVEC